MAMRDYGAILVKDGNRVNTEMFMSKTDTGYDDGDFTHDYFVCVGDANFMVGAYKYNLAVKYGDREIITYPYVDERDLHYFTDADLVPIFVSYMNPRQSAGFEILENVLDSGVTIRIDRIDPDDGLKLKASFTYNGHNYEIYYGYGVDPDNEVFEDITSADRYDYSETERKVFSALYELPLVDNWMDFTYTE